MIQPAIKSYYFGKGYQDLWDTIKGAFSNTISFARLSLDFISEFWFKRPISKIVFVFWLIPLTVVVFFSLAAAISVLIIGTITTFIVSVYHVLILAVIMLLVYILFSVVWVGDRIYLKVKNISSVCPACHEKYLIPTYRCSCGREHTQLIPSKYGIFHRRCECGKLLGTTFLSKRGKDMTVVCPNCNVIMSGYSAGTARVPICIPVIGGRSSGKSAFITAFVHDFREKLAPRNGWVIQEYDKEAAMDYRVLYNNYMSGTIQQTSEFHSIQHMKVSSIPIRFVVGGKKFRPEREIHIYDVAGEAFTSDNLLEIQKQYEYCHGIVMVLDPFSIRQVWKKYEDELVNDANTFDTVSNVELQDVSYALLDYLQKVTGLNEKDISDIPLAVVLGKIDAAGLDKELGEKVVRGLVTESGGFSNPADVDDYLCRKFLVKYGMESLVSLINSKFKNNRYFACSAIGHSLGEGQYNPVGVMTPMEWLFREADSQMDSAWNDNEFTRKPFALKKDIHDLRGEI